MDFKKTHINVNNVQKPHEGPKKKEKPSKSVVPENNDKKLAKSPSNPKYWQSVAFCGNVKPPSADELEEKRKKLGSALVFASEEERAKYSKKLEEIAPLGSKAMDAYIALAENSIRTYETERRAFFDEMTDFLFENYSKIEDVPPGRLCSVLSSLSHPAKANFEQRKAFFQDFINDETYPLEDKLNWFDFVSRAEWLNVDFAKGFSEKPFGEWLDTVGVFKEYLATAKDDDARRTMKDLTLPLDTIGKYVALNKAGAFDSEEFASMFEKLGTFYREETTEQLASVISNLHSKIIEEGDSSFIDHFRNLRSEYLSDRPLPLETLSELTGSKDDFIKEKVALAILLAEEKGSPFFSSEREIDDTFSVLTPENIEDFAECYREESKTPDFSRYYFIKDYTNPKTGLFDKKLYDAVKEYEANLTDDGRNSFSWFGHRNADVIKSAVDMKTGEISPVALSFIDKYFLMRDDGSKASKLKSAAQAVKGRFVYVREPLYKRGHDMENHYSTILDALKDKSGAFNAENIKYMTKILEAPIYTFSPKFDFFNNLKDENGVVDKTKFKMTFDFIIKSGDLSGADKFSEALVNLGPEEALMALYSAEEILGSESNAMRNFGQFIENCWGDGEDKIENGIFVKNIVELTDDTVGLNDTLFNVIKNEDNRELIYDFAQTYNLHGCDINSLANAIEESKNEDGTLDDFKISKLRKFGEEGVLFYHFNALFKACTQDEDNPKKGFLSEEFDKVLKLYNANPNLAYEVEPQHLIQIVNGNFMPTSLKFKEKVSLLNVFMKFKQEPEKCGFEVDLIDKVIDILDKSIGDESIYLPVSEDVRTDFVQSVLGNSEAEKSGYTHFENVLKESIPVLEDMQKGIPLSFTREDFLKELSALCDDEDKIKILKEKAGIIPIFKDNNGQREIQGYEGIMLLEKLDKNDEFQGKLYNLMHRFMYENEVYTPNTRLTEELNRVIKACPEFINIIGKPQHGTHKYSLDVHSLLVLAYSIDNPNYLNLNSTDKVMLKIATLFHDIAKQEATVDNGHQEPSSLYARSIVKKFFKNGDSKDRVYELIRNHHWLAQFNTSNNKEELAKEMAYKFRRPNDFEIAKIMANADLKAVSEEFYDSHKDALRPENIKPIEDMLDVFYATGCAAFTDAPSSERDLIKHSQTLNGREFKVINFHQIGEDEDLYEYGFEKGKTKKDVNFLIHMVDKNKIEQDLRTVDMLTSSVNGGVLSESIISPKYKRTYCDRKYGVILSQINANLINMNPSNQGSGYEKDFSSIMQLVFNDRLGARNNFRKGFLKELGVLPNEISDKEFGEFYKNNIVAKSSYSQFHEDREYSIGSRKFTGKEITDAIKRYQNSLIDVQEMSHNELVGYIPKIRAVIAKEKTLEDVPCELLDFAYKNNLPVVLV